MKLTFYILSLCCLGFANDLTQERAAKTIVITCASGELGSAIAKNLAGENNLILVGRNAAKLKALQNELSSQYSYTYQIATFDYSDQASFLNFENWLLGRNEPISGLVLITPRPQFGSDLLQGESEWLQLFQNTFTGPVELLKKALPFLNSQGKIVIIGGTTSVQLIPEYGPACIVRRMWTSYAKALSHQLGPKGIYVNVLSPGVVLTNFHKERIAKKATSNHIDYDTQMDKEVSTIPLRRHGDLKEIAQSVKFLLSSDSDFITGVNLVIDGGITVSY